MLPVFSDNVTWNEIGQNSEDTGNPYRSPLSYGDVVAAQSLRMPMVC
jgi:hypothetical protein